MKIQDENVRIYHIRYPNYAAVQFDLVPKIYQIEGVQNIQTKPYQCNVIKSPAYSWDEIENKIKAILIKFEEEIEKGNIGNLEQKPEKKDGI